MVFFEWNKQRELLQQYFTVTDKETNKNKYIKINTCKNIQCLSQQLKTITVFENRLERKKNLKQTNQGGTNSWRTNLKKISHIAQSKVH